MSLILDQYKNEDCRELGFTLIELIAVLVIVGIISITATVYYVGLLTDARRHEASALIAATQSHLSLEFSRAVVAGLSLDGDVQSLCQNVVISNAGVGATVNCSGNLAQYVSINAAIDNISVIGEWISPSNSGP